MDANPPAIAIRSALTHLARAVGICVCATAVRASEVVVYTDGQHPVVATAGTRIVELDAAARLTAELAADLPPAPSQAAQTVRQRLQEGSGALQLRMASAANDVVEAWQLGVEKIPAVVVDRRYVVYGEADVARALDAITRYREARR
nr:TIGR03757 family integrating conjugative element protein [uncultured Caldimonas sp.]